MWRRGRAGGRGARASAPVFVVGMVLMLAGACSSESQVSVPTRATVGVEAAPPTSTAATQPADASPPDESSPASTRPDDAAPADTDAGGSAGVPDGDTIVTFPGSVTIVQNGVNLTIDISACRGNGADGTATITAELSYFGGSAIDRGSVNVQLLDTHGRRATVAALLVSVPPRTTVPLDFAADGTGSPARAIGEIEACWLDRVHDVSFFTAV